MICLTTGRVRFYNQTLRWSWQGWIQEFLIRGIQTLVQKGLLHFIVANYSSPTPRPTSHSCMHVIIIPQPLYDVLESLDEKMNFPSNLFTCKRVQTKRKICAKVVNAKFAHPFAPLCIMVLHIRHLPPLRSLIHPQFAHFCTWANLKQIHFFVQWILLVKNAPLEHPPLVLGNKDCTDFINIIGGYPKTIYIFEYPWNLV